jgi:5-(carboxyamino)imidazole ribonucleotide synthase
MLALAAARLGMKTHIFCPDPESPAFDVTPRKTIAAYDDEAALAAFAAAVDVVTYEFENVPVASARFLAALKPLHPGAVALEVAQDRLREKAFIGGLGIAVAPWRPVVSLAELDSASAELGLPAVLKTTRLGYDGKGQRLLRAPADAAAAYAALAPKPLVLEAFIPFDREVSVIVARGANGDIRAFDPAENVHRHHILATSTVPAHLAAAQTAAAADAASRIAAALDYVGVLGVEFFVAGDTLLVNEIAPRVHNSGHWTEAVCVTDQFEQHIRAILGWPLGDPTRLADVVLENLIGEAALALPTRLGPGIRPHLYGKREARSGRKMGHLDHIVLPPLK